jgi:hypothetical protein
MNALRNTAIAVIAGNERAALQFDSGKRQWGDSSEPIFRLSEGALKL